ncbi:MAG: hypothetical protein IPO65_11955 [Saprospiraceae bacterium]|nr:hypothetical protein [Saprospiraceae bacterium]
MKNKKYAGWLVKSNGVASIFTIVLIVVIDPHPAIAAGMLLAAACPGAMFPITLFT